MFSARSLTAATLLAVAGLALTPSTRFAAAATVESGACGTKAAPLNGIKFIDATAMVSTASLGNFITVASTPVSFTQAKAGCVIVQFSAEALGSVEAPNVQVQALLDATACGPGPTVIGGYVSSGFMVAGSMTFICKAVAAGPHTIRIQYRGIGAMGTVFIGARSTTVQYMQ
jgi:hypothetical protein